MFSCSCSKGLSNDLLSVSVLTVKSLGFYSGMSGLEHAVVRTRPVTREAFIPSDNKDLFRVDGNWRKISFILMSNSHIMCNVFAVYTHWAVYILYLDDFIKGNYSQQFCDWDFYSTRRKDMKPIIVRGPWASYERIVLWPVIWSHSVWWVTHIIMLLNVASWLITH